MSTPWHVRITRQSGTARAGLALGTAFTALALVVSMTGPAQARPPAKPGNVGGLDITSMDLANDPEYTVDASWNPSSNTTSYLVKLVNASGTVLDQERVTGTTFEGTTTLAAGSKVSVSVTPFNDRRRGRTASTSDFLPDQTDPTAAYTVSPENSGDGHVTVTQTQLADNLSTAAQLTQTIDWGDASPNSTGPGTTTSFAHTYSTTPAVYHPVVTIKDAAGNETTVELAAAVKDLAAPTGSYSVSPATGYARWTTVTLTQDAIDDDLSANEDISRTVDWGDGPAETWTDGTTLTHRYDAAIAATPTVTLEDEAGNVAAPISSSAVSITADTTAPKLRFKLPTTGRQSVSKWTTLRGRAIDSETGVKNVRLKVVEKRHAKWYAYKSDTRRWVSAASQRGAWKKATTTTATTVGRRWSLPVKRLTVGTLVYRASGTDNVGNKSAWLKHSQLLTRR
jgi:hypothetical protein